MAVPGEGSGRWHLCACIRWATTSTLELAELKGRDLGLCSHPGLSTTPGPAQILPSGLSFLRGIELRLGPGTETRVKPGCGLSLLPKAHPSLSHPLFICLSTCPLPAMLPVKGAGPGTAQEGPAEPLLGTGPQLQVESGPVGEPWALLLPGARAHAVQPQPQPPSEPWGGSGRWICAWCPLPAAGPHLPCA